MPWTGGAFLVGAMAIAGLPPLNGFASEWLTLQALLHVSAYGDVGDGIGRRDRARRARRRPRRSRCSASSRSSGSCCSAGRGGRPSPPRWRRRCRCAARSSSSRSPASSSGSRRASCSGCSSGSRPGRRARRRTVGLHLPGTGSLPTLGIAIVLVGLTGASSLLRGRPSAAPAPSWACGQLVEPRAQLDERGLHEAAAARARAGAPPEREIVVRSRGRRRAGGLLQRARPRT